MVSGDLPGTCTAVILKICGFAALAFNVASLAGAIREAIWANSTIVTDLAVGRMMAAGVEVIVIVPGMPQIGWL